jgi:DNA-binding MarR family transcriptional regulator
MTPTEEIPTGVTVDGKPLEIVLQEMEDTRKKKEIRENYKGEILGKVCYTKGTYPYQKWREVKEPNGKVRRLTMSQIKKEYGKMREATVTEKVIQSLNSSYYKNLRTVIEEIHTPRGSTSAAISNLLREGLIDTQVDAENRSGKKNKFYTLQKQYRELDTGAIYNIFKERQRDYRKGLRHKVLRDKVVEVELLKARTTQTTASRAVTTTTLPETILTKIANLFTDELKARVRIDIHIHFE